MSNCSPGGITFGPWLVYADSAPPTVTVAVEERSRHTTVGSWARVSAVLSRTRVFVLVAATLPAPHVTVSPSWLIVAPPPAWVKVVPVGAVTTTSAPLTGASPVLVSRIRDG